MIDPNNLPEELETLAKDADKIVRYWGGSLETAEKVVEFVSKWVKYGEYITVEFDTDAGTAVVVPE